jgi:ubiquitin-conjugating enzyme E2 Q
MSVQGQRMREYPTGMCLLVPPLPSQIQNSSTSQGQSIAPTVTALAGTQVLEQNVSLASQPTSKFNSYNVKYDPSRKDIIFNDEYPCPVRNGDWIVVAPSGKFIGYALQLGTPHC